MQSQSKILFIASHGGHLRELEYIADKLLINIKTHYLIHTNINTTDNQNQFFVKNFFWHTPITALLSSLRIILILSKVKPKLVISTGAAPGAVAICIAKLMGMKSIWFETLTSQTKLSLSGKLAFYFSDQFFVQNETLANKLKVPYNGNML